MNAELKERIGSSIIESGTLVFDDLSPPDNDRASIAVPYGVVPSGFDPSEPYLVDLLDDGQEPRVVFSENVPERFRLACAAYELFWIFRRRGVSRLCGDAIGLELRYVNPGERPHYAKMRYAMFYRQAAKRPSGDGWVGVALTLGFYHDLFAQRV